VAIVDPAHLAHNPLPPPVLIEEVLVDQRPRLPAAFPAGSRQLHFEYTAASFAVPSRVRFRYRLDGFEREWVDAGTRRSADYTNLAPGAYRFRVTACNEDGVWSATGASISFEIRPFFYQTKWFLILSLLLAAAAAYALYRARLAQLARRAHELSRIVDERTAQLRAAQADLVRAERMASVAALVRGIAHELNNPINFISGNLEPLRRYSRFVVALAQKLADGTPRSREEITALARLSPRKDLEFVGRDLDKLMNDIAEGARRAQLIVSDLQGLTAGPQRALVEVDLARAVVDTLRLLAPRLHDIAVSCDVSGAPRLTAHAGQIEQLVTNLVDNAAQAVRAGGHVAVRAKSDAGAACLEVRDDGCGMSEEVRRRATEPFFTTRPAGEGSGLGLAIVASIVAERRGTLAIESAPDRGTTVRVRLPVDGPAHS
jgi:signal transduction histidine kinase